MLIPTSGVYLKAAVFCWTAKPACFLVPQTLFFMPRSSHNHRVLTFWRAVYVRASSTLSIYNLYSPGAATDTDLRSSPLRVVLKASNGLGGVAKQTLVITIISGTSAQHVSDSNSHVQLYPHTPGGTSQNRPPVATDMPAHFATERTFVGLDTSLYFFDPNQQVLDCCALR